MTFYLSRYVNKAKLGLFCNLTSKFSSQSEAAVKVNRSLLTELRKKTGFSFFKCNNALKLSNNDIQTAEEWLYEQAENEGWAKATKLQGRSTSQGLVGVLAEENYAALVQVRCETDFVARNELFQELVATTAKATINFRRNVIEQNMKVNSLSDGNITHLREYLLAHEIQELPVPNQNSTVEERVVALVGKTGENIKLNKALGIATSKENIIGVACHGNISTTLNNCAMGTYGAAVVLKLLSPNIEKPQVENLARSLSQHVIGMNPKCLSPTKDIPEEDTLLCQEYLLDEKKTIRDMISEAGVEIVDFVRYGVDD